MLTRAHARETVKKIEKRPSTLEKLRSLHTRTRPDSKQFRRLLKARRHPANKNPKGHPLGDFSSNTVRQRLAQRHKKAASRRTPPTPQALTAPIIGALVHAIVCPFLKQVPPLIEHFRPQVCPLVFVPSVCMRQTVVRYMKVFAVLHRPSLER